MRIIITPKGEIEVTEIANSVGKKMSRTTSMINDSLLHKKKSLHHNLSKTMKSFRKEGISLIKRDELKVTPKQLSPAKHIKVSNSRNLISRVVLKQYNEEIDEGAMEKFKKSLIPSKEVRDYIVSNLLPKVEINKNHRAEMIELRNIIRPETKNRLEKEFIEKEKEKNINQRVTCDNFRSIYQPIKQNIISMDNILKKKIRKDRVNIIKYFNQKKKVSDLYLKNFSNYDYEKLNKLNKIAQIHLINKEADKKRDNIIEKKMNSNERELKVNYSKQMGNLKKRLKVSKGILDNYILKKDNTAILKSFIREMNECYWDKNKSNILMRRVSQRLIRSERTISC